MMILPGWFDPVPETGIRSVFVLPPELLIRLREALRKFNPLGEKVTFNGVVMPLLIMMGAAGVAAKSPGLLPVDVMVLMTRSASPVFFRFNTNGELVVLSCCAGKLRLGGVITIFAGDGTAV